MPDTLHIKKTVNAWLSYWSADDDSPDRAENSWVSDELLDWAMENDSESLWLFVQEAYPRQMSERVASILAAGPLEDLLAYHGPAYIEKVEHLARTDPKFNNLLGGVWRNSMTVDVWERVQAVRNKVW